MSNLSGTAMCANALSSETCWIFDTGATDHMVCSPSLMTTSTQVTNRHVHLPNHALAGVTHTSTIRFSDELVLHNVLCVPSFRLNLISVTKLTKTSSCYAVFTNEFSFVQDQRLGKMIGMGTE